MKRSHLALLLCSLIALGATWAGTSINYVPLPTSHHFGRLGMGAFYHKENGGLELLTNVPYEELACDNCHHKSKQLPNGRPITYGYDPSCEDCHNNALLQEYDKTGQIVVAKWDDSKKKPAVAKGMIPIPPNWQRALQFDFAEFTGDVTQPGQKDKWVFLKQNADLMQMLPDYAYPLTDVQLTKLRVPVEDLPIAKKPALIRMGLRLQEEAPDASADSPSATPRTSPPKALSHE